MSDNSREKLLENMAKAYERSIGSTEDAMHAVLVEVERVNGLNNRAYQNGYHAGKMEGIKLAREELFKDLESSENSTTDHIVTKMIKRLYRMRKNMVAG